MSFQHPAQIPTGHPVSAPYNFTALARAAIRRLVDSRQLCTSLGWQPGKDTRSGRSDRRQLITFDMIPDDVLLEIFDFYVNGDERGMQAAAQVWIWLVHVCRRWRSVVFKSPLRLNLRLLCTPGTPTRHFLDIWPPFPLIIRSYNDHSSVKPSIADNIIAALEHSDRVYKIELMLPHAELRYFTNSAPMLKSFPELTDLHLCRLRPFSFGYEDMSILSNSFLDGSAPRLRSLYSENVSFPRLPRLLLSTIHLVHLQLTSIPRSGYIPPEAMATSLPALTSLELLRLWFDYPPPRPALETRRPPPPPLTRSILPSLIKIQFKGASEYLDVILAPIDAPRLESLDITFFNQMIFDTPQLFQFIGRSPTLKAPEKGYIGFSRWAVNVRFPSDNKQLSVHISCTASSEWCLSCIEQICTSSLPFLPMLEELYISGNRLYGVLWQDDVDNALWLNLFRPFVSVKRLHISEDLVPRIAPALKELVGGRTTEVLPLLENLFLEGYQPSRPLQDIEKFAAARLLTSRPVAVSCWDEKRSVSRIPV